MRARGALMVVVLAAVGLAAWLVAGGFSPGAPPPPEPTARPEPGAPGRC